MRAQRSLTRTGVLFNQIRNPLLLVLFSPPLASAMTGEWVDAVIVVVDRARHGRHRLLARVSARRRRPRLFRRACARKPASFATAMQSMLARTRSCPAMWCCLSAGSLVPADGVILEAADFFVSEAVLTGESFPVEKRPGPVADGAACATDELRVPRHQRAKRHRAMPDRGGRAGTRNSAASRSASRCARRKRNSIAGSAGSATC